MAEERIESYPFDSNPPTEFDDYGRPIYDRAVGAHMLRYTYKQFFSDGVFGTPADALQIGNGDGLSVTIQPGMWIIEGAIGAVGFDTGEAKVVKLSDAAPQGKVTYGIFLRFDDNEGRRSMYLVVRAGEAGGTVPSVETAPAVSELRLGYVTVPSGATDLTDATITMEKGLAVCPYAAPFAEIDMSQVTADAKDTAIAALDSLMAYFEQYREMVDAAVDETLAGQLQTQINQLKEQLDNFDLSTSVDNKTIEYTQDFGETAKTLKVKDGGITAAKLAADAVTADKIADGAVTAGSLDQSVFDAIEPQWETLWEGKVQYGNIPIDGVNDYKRLRFTVQLSIAPSTGQEEYQCEVELERRRSASGVEFFSAPTQMLTLDTGSEIYTNYYCMCGASISATGLKGLLRPSGSYYFCGVVNNGGSNGYLTSSGESVVKVEGAK